MLQREVELILKQKGFERGVTDILMRIIEEHNDMKSMVREMVEAISSMATTIQLLNVVADGMKSKIDSMAHKEDDGRSTQSIAKGD